MFFSFLALENATKTSWLMCRAYTKQKPIFYVLDANVVVKT